MSEIRKLKPEGLWRNFDELTKVPLHQDIQRRCVSF